MKEFGENLKDLRLLSRYTQKELGNIFNVSQRTIHAWENDIQEPDIEMLIKIAQFFDTTVDDLIGFEEYEKLIQTQNNTLNQRLYNEGKQFAQKVIDKEHNKGKKKNA